MTVVDEVPVILTTPEECDAWMTAPVEEALQLQRPLADGLLRVVARGKKQDPPGAAPEMAPALLLAQGADMVDLDGPLLLAEDRDHPIRYDGAGAHPAELALWG